VCDLSPSLRSKGSSSNWYSVWGYRFLKIFLSNKWNKLDQTLALIWINWLYRPNNKRFGNKRIKKQFFKKRLIVNDYIWDNCYKSSQMISTLQILKENILFNISYINLITYQPNEQSLRRLLGLLGKFCQLRSKLSPYSQSSNQRKKMQNHY
jgi:hypothetical protein